MLIGYTRVSTHDQTSALQIEALKKAGCESIFLEKASGSERDRLELRAELAYIRGDLSERSPAHSPLLTVLLS